MKKVILVVLDGWGKAKDISVSAIDKANTPFIDYCYKNFPNCNLSASGFLVGLPKNQVGNSEVGHINLGAGRIVYQNLLKINKSIENRSFFKNKILKKFFTYALNFRKNIHIIGLLSDGGVHSHINHLFKIIDLASSYNGIKNIFIHAFTDGRDTHYKSGIKYLELLLNYINFNKIVKLSTVIGRYYSMDRNFNWDRIKKAYDLIVNGLGEKTNNIINTIEYFYKKNITDEFMQPIVLIDSYNKPLSKINTGDVVICFNYRTDRSRQITKVLTQENFIELNMKKLNIYYLTMTRYDKTFKNIYTIIDEDNLSNTLGEVLEKNKKTQLRIAETEKYPHVTFFFSGGREKKFKNEKRIIIPSPSVSTYDLKPEMSAYDICSRLFFELKKNNFDFICLNFANPDMVGHSGIMSATIKACEVVDECTKFVYNIALKKNYTVLLLSDHGNADCMINSDGSPNTNHTSQPVPFFVLDKTKKIFIKNGKLGDIAPTILDILSITKPHDMSGNSLLLNN